MATPSASRAIKLFGTAVPEAKSRRLTAGPLSVELDNGALRYVRLGEVEVLRAIAFLVRDENWGTYAPAIDKLVVRQGADGFRVSYEASCGDDHRSIRYLASITGLPDGSLDFAAAATAHGDFTTNRTGFIVLHPLRGVAGRPVEVLHVDGRLVADRFPAIINPLQPFYEIRALTHEALPGVKAVCRMTGDSFEMEDHRNWTDASYKTYVRPLALPWPYVIPNGTEFRQSVNLTFQGRLPRAGKVGGRRRIGVALGRAARTKMPQIGLGLPAEEAVPALAAIDLIKAAGPQLLVARIDLRHGHGGGELERYRQLGEATGAGVVLEIVIPGRRAPAAELARLAKEVARSGLVPAAVAISPAADLKAVLPGSKGPKVPPLADIYRAARAAFPGVPLGGGMFSFFTELNRKRPPAELLDFVTHTTCPIVHAADDRSVMETLEALPYVVQSTRAFIGKAAYRVGPSAIGTRDNPYGAATAANPENRRICLAAMDPRQRGLFGAAWTLGYLAALARGGVSAVAIGAPTGPQGIVFRPADYPQPYFDKLRSAAVYPAYHVVAAFATAAGRRQVAAESSDRSAIDAIAWQRPRGLTLWLANLTGDEQQVALSGLPSGRATLRRLDEDSFGPASLDPRFFAAGGRRLGRGAIALGPYAVASVELDMD
jgi:hypothetical protein